MFKRYAATAAVCISLVFTFAAPAEAQDALTAIQGPGHGRIVYGPMQGETTDAGAIAAMLRSVHSQYGDRPRVGRLFRVRGTRSVAAFFAAVNRARGTPMAGLVIVAGPAGHPEAALVTDDASRFASSINPMLQSLFAVWNPEGNNGAVAALHPVSLRDNSATVSLPAAWTIRRQSGAGTIIAQGPNGEAALLGYPLIAMNTGDPRVQRTRFVNGVRNSYYTRVFYYPYGAEPARTYIDLFQKTRQRDRLPPADIQIANISPVSSDGRAQCEHVTGQFDLRDGKGRMEFNTVFCSGPLSPLGQYTNLLYQTAVPLRMAEKERATMGAILASFSVNDAVIAPETSAIAAPAIEAIHEIGRDAAQVQQQIAERHRASRERANPFGDYLLDRSMINGSRRGTAWSETADRLVRDHPQRYEYADKPGYWKGIDY